MTIRVLHRLRPLVQAAALLLFFFLLLSTRLTDAPTWAGSLFFRLDPLAALASGIAARTWPAPLALSLLTLALTLLVGRAWCGWLCPLGTVLDLFPLGRKRRARGLPSASRWRLVKHLLLLALLGAALLGSLALMPLDPITLLTRTSVTGLLPALNAGLLALEKLLYGLPVLQPPVDWFEENVRAAWLPGEAPYYLPSLLLVAALVVVIALNRVAPRFWCRYLCPLGALLGLVSKGALWRRTVDPACGGCSRCVRTCPTGTIDPAHGFRSDPAECTVCLHCVVDCPQAAARFAPVVSGAGWQSYDPTRRQALAALAAGVGAAALFRVLPRGWPLTRTLIRPPGAQGEELWARCIRCGQCMQVCPTSGLQPAWYQAGPEGLGTPLLVPRTGCCDYACHRCGQVCPTGAIPPLDLEQKRRTVIGLAEIDRDRCLPWAQATACIVCEEMCPVPDKAIELELAEAIDAAGETITVQRPAVIAERCIGCGICEFKCPLEGAAAIRVVRPPGGPVG